MKTYTPKADDIQRQWWIVDAEGRTLGRLATEVARVLRGKHKPIYTPHLDTGDHVIVVNAEKVTLTGRKAEQKTYFRHSGWMGGEK
ncbi:MAG: 50S ribosomal protein L13, partial [Gemmatimonadota bacterium]